MREEGCEVGPGLGGCGKILVHVLWDVGDKGADAAIIEVHGVDASDSETANTVGYGARVGDSKTLKRYILSVFTMSDLLNI